MSNAVLLADTESDAQLTRHLTFDGFELVSDGDAHPDLVLVADVSALDELRQRHGAVHARFARLASSEEAPVGRRRTVRAERVGRRLPLASSELEQRALEAKQGFLALQPAPIADELAVCADHAVTRQDDRKWIPVHHG